MQVTVQTSKFFSVTKNSNIAQVRMYGSVLKIVTLKNFDGCTSCMPLVLSMCSSRGTVESTNIARRDTITQYNNPFCHGDALQQK